MNLGPVLLGLALVAALVAASFLRRPRDDQQDTDPERDTMPPQRPYTMTAEVLPSYERLPYDGSGVLLDGGEEEPDGLP